MKRVFYQDNWHNDIKVDFLYTNLEEELESKEDIQQLEEEIENIYWNRNCSKPMT